MELRVFGDPVLFHIGPVPISRAVATTWALMGALTLVYAFITERTVLGRRIYALGGNEKAAKLSGIKTERLTFLAFVNKVNVK